MRPVDPLDSNLPGILSESVRWSPERPPASHKMIMGLAGEAPALHQALALPGKMSATPFARPFGPAQGAAAGCMMRQPVWLCGALAGQAGRVRGHVQRRGGDGRAT